MSFLSLLRRDRDVLAFGFAFTFASSLGQTFFISLFVPSLSQAVAVGEPLMAVLYGAATVASALCLPALGRRLDDTDLLRFSVWVLLALAIGGLVLATATQVAMLAAGLFLLRLAGQGLMSHIALTGAARFFEEHRGKALSLTGLGHAAGEGVLPLTVVVLIAWLDWRWAMALCCLVLAGVIAPAAMALVRRNAKFRCPLATLVGVESRKRASSALLSDPEFWRLLPLLVASPFTITALIFHQGWLAGSLGLPLAVFAAAFVGFALIQAPTGFLSGAVVDRIGSRRVLQLHVAPFIAGVLLLAVFGNGWAVWAFLALAGVTNAAGALLRTSMVAELVTPDRLGAARSLVSACMVVSTAAGPAVYGLFIAAGLEPPAVLLTAALSLALCVLPTIRWRKLFRV
ncbi:MAG: MFS transporter [Brevundimonas sp.]|uniref:MFS transporter n=1 Tax=Brevundimonas sp. TaxID=1871086 RepID=UPI00391B1CCF